MAVLALLMKVVYVFWGGASVSERARARPRGASERELSPTLSLRPPSHRPKPKPHTNPKPRRASPAHRLAILLPPVAVFLDVGLSTQFWLNLLLTLLVRWFFLTRFFFCAHAVAALHSPPPPPPSLHHQGWLPGVVHALWLLFANRGI